MTDSTDDDSQALFCSECGYQFDEGDFEEHVIDMIFQVGVWQCPNCGSGNDLD